MESYSNLAHLRYVFQCSIWADLETLSQQILYVQNGVLDHCVRFKMSDSKNNFDKISRDLVKQEITRNSLQSVARWRRKAWCLDTRGFILKKIQWHIHAGSWSLVNCWREALTRHYIRCSWILMNAAVGLMDGLGLDGDRCIRVIPGHPPFSVKEEALPACKETIVRNIQRSLRDQVMQQIWMYYKEKLTKNLADLNTFETSMSLRDRVTT